MDFSGEHMMQGKQETFNSVFNTYYRQLCFFATQMINSPEEAKDIVQDVFLLFWKMDHGKFPNIKTVKAYLYNAVQTRCLNFLRNEEIRRKNHKMLVQEEWDDDYFLCQRIQSEIVAEIFAAVEELPEKCREIFKKSYLENMSDKEIADELEISLNTIKTQKQRAKQYLRVRLGDLFSYVSLFFPGI